MSAASLRLSPIQRGRISFIQRLLAGAASTLIPLILSTLLLIALSTSLLAHSFYDPECCSDRDCRPVSADDLEEVENGCWKYRPTGVKFCGKQVRPSQDKHWHICTSPTGVPYCAYIQMG